jgi:hypothetical protein
MSTHLSDLPVSSFAIGFFRLDMVPGRVGVAKDRLSGFEKFEAPDPAEWTSRGHAIVNPDPRGAYDSEGNLLYVMRAISIARPTLTASSQPLWHSRGPRRVRSGRSPGYDAMVQRQRGIRRVLMARYRSVVHSCRTATTFEVHRAVGGCNRSLPRHFVPRRYTADGFPGLFVQQTVWYGMTPPPGSSHISDTSRSTGRNEQEDVVRMLQEHPHFDDYWQDKRAKVEQINLPAYVLASYSSFLHTFGSFRGFEAIQNKNKWYVDRVRSSDVSQAAIICRPL